MAVRSGHGYANVQKVTAAVPVASYGHVADYGVARFVAVVPGISDYATGGYIYQQTANNEVQELREQLAAQSKALQELQIRDEVERRVRAAAPVIPQPVPQTVVDPNALDNVLSSIMQQLQLLQGQVQSIQQVQGVQPPAADAPQQSRAGVAPMVQQPGSPVNAAAAVQQSGRPVNSASLTSQQRLNAAVSVLGSRCKSCHTGATAKGELELFGNDGRVRPLTSEQWKQIWDSVESGKMPKAERTAKLPITIREAFAIKEVADEFGK